MAEDKTKACMRLLEAALNQFLEGKDRRHASQIRSPALLASS